MTTVNTHGGRRAGAGRPLGSKRKLSEGARKLARDHGPDAINMLASIMRDASEPSPARISAAKELLDRGYGKAT